MLMDKAPDGGERRTRRGRDSVARGGRSRHRASNSPPRIQRGPSSTCRADFAIGIDVQSSARMPTDKAPDCGERDEVVEGAIRSNARAAEPGTRASTTAAHQTRIRARRVELLSRSVSMLSPIIEAQAHGQSYRLRRTTKRRGRARARAADGHARASTSLPRQHGPEHDV